MPKVSQQVLVSPMEKQDITALAIVRQESQAEIVRRLFEIALPQVKSMYASHLAELFEVLGTMNVDIEEALKEMSAVRVRGDGVRRSLTISDLRTGEGTWRKTFPWPPAAKR